MNNNDVVVEAWNTVLFDKFVRFRHLLIAGLGFERFDTDICIGRNLADAVEFAMALGPAGEIIRLAGAEGERLKPQVALALRETLSVYARDDGVWAPSSTWFITARNPAGAQS